MDDFMNFDFFASKLNEVREYQSALDYLYLIGAYMKRPDAKGVVEVISQDEHVPYNDHFRASHFVRNADGSDSLEVIKETFKVDLPEDFAAFYGAWSEVLLVLREPYWIMPGASIVASNQRFRGSHDEKFPCNLIRFARYFDESGQNFALRRKNPESAWTISMIDDLDYHENDWEAGDDKFDYKVTDLSFTDWLHRMLETDGTPWFPGNPSEEELCQTMRVG